MAEPKKASASVGNVGYFEKLVSTIPGLKRKGDANPYTSLNGNMFTPLHQSRTLAIRLPEDKREEFLKNHKTKLFEAYGAVTKGVRDRARCAAGEHEGTAEVFQGQLRIRSDDAAE